MAARALSLTVTVTETVGFLSELCPSRVAPPVQVPLALGAHLSERAPVFRGVCGTVNNTSLTVVQGVNAFQGYNLLVTATDNDTGQVLSSAPFFWQDVPNQGV